MSKFEWIMLVVGFAFWWRLDRLGKQLEAVSHLVRQEMAELVGNEDRVQEMLKVWRQEEAEQKKANWQSLIAYSVLGAGALAWWWFTTGQN
jgi:streptomycin 6-kinase